MGTSCNPRNKLQGLGTLVSNPVDVWVQGDSQPVYWGGEGLEGIRAKTYKAMGCFLIFDMKEFELSLSQALKT